MTPTEQHMARARELCDLVTYVTERAGEGTAARMEIEMDIAAALAEAEARGRNNRQSAISSWCVAAFGADEALSLPQRGVRLLEEAIEAYQATGAAPHMAHRLVDYVFSRPVGSLSQELGGVGVTTLALAAAAGLSADDAEAHEAARVLAKDPAYFAERNRNKNAAGFRALATTPEAPHD